MTQAKAFKAQFGRRSARLSCQEDGWARATSRPLPSFSLPMNRGLHALAGCSARCCFWRLPRVYCSSPPTSGCGVRPCTAESFGVPSQMIESPNRSGRRLRCCRERRIVQMRPKADERAARVSGAAVDQLRIRRNAWDVRECKHLLSACGMARWRRATRRTVCTYCLADT